MASVEDHELLFETVLASVEDLEFLLKRLWLFSFNIKTFHTRFGTLLQSDPFTNR